MKPCLTRRANMIGSEVVQTNSGSVITFSTFSPLSNSALPSIDLATSNQLARSREALSSSPHETSIQMMNFFTTLRLLTEDLNLNLEPLHRIVSIMRHSHHPEIKAALTKNRGYTGRLFSTESWTEWAETRTALGRVVDKLMSYIEDPEHNGFRMDQATVLAANRQAVELLTKLDQSDFAFDLPVEEPSVLPSAQKIITAAVQLAVQNFVGIHAGLSTQQLSIMNLMSLANYCSSRSLKTKLSGNMMVSGSVTVADQTMKLLVDGVEQVFHKIGEDWQDAMGRQWEVIAGDIKDGTKATLSLVGSGIVDYTQEILNVLPQVANAMGREIADGIWTGLSESKASRELIGAIESQFKNGKDFIEILEFLQLEAAPDLSPRDKTSGYDYLFAIARRINVPEPVRGSFYLAIAETARNDAHLESYPGFFWKIAETLSLAHNSSTLVSNMVPHTEIRNLIASGNEAAITNRLQRDFTQMGYLDDGIKTGGSLEGAVVSFDREDCPPGWEKFIPAEERVFFGASKGYPLGSTGGSKEHKLTKDELPSFDVPAGGYGLVRKSALDDGAVTAGGGDAKGLGTEPAIMNDVSEPSGKLGNDKPFSTLPPYIALTVCKKLPSTKYEGMDSNIRRQFGLNK